MNGLRKGKILVVGSTNTDMCDTFICHDSLNIGKVEINKARNINKVCDSLNCLL